ncbi:hypothetical protein [Paractinoplanes toevensis]|nr:hypothetical protein [Actinoplanes toevensis]
MTQLDLIGAAAVVAGWNNLLVSAARTGRWIPAVGNSVRST